MRAEGGEGTGGDWETRGTRRTRETWKTTPRAGLFAKIHVIHIQDNLVGRKALNRKKLEARVAPETITIVKDVAYQLGYLYNNEGSIGKLLDAIASGEVTLTKSIKVDDRY